MTACREICGVRIDAVNYGDAVAQVAEWARRGESRIVCFSNAHAIMEANDRERFHQVLASADIVAPDGMPLVWALQLLGIQHATRVYGPDFTRHLAARAAESRLPIGLYGGTGATLTRFTESLRREYSDINIVYAFAPPFRPLTAEESDCQLAAIKASGARILLVGLGCPKQEEWMADHRGQIPAVMLGVGAAFDFLSGAKPQAPRWMMAAGLEWLFRLLTEPRRLWLRYLKQNPRFAARFLAQLIRMRLSPATR